MAVLRGTVGFLAFHIAFSFRREGIASAWLGMAIGASCVGTLLGSALAPRLRSVLREEHIVLGALIGVAVTGIVEWRTASVGMAAVLALVVACAAASARLAFDSLVQRDNGDAVQGRAFARFEACFQIVWVVGALLPVLVPFPSGVGGLVVALFTAGGALAFGFELFSGRSSTPAPPPAGPDSPAPGSPAGPGPAPRAPLAAAPTTELPVAPTIELPLPAAPEDTR
jgi:hypothetical protein